MIEKEKAEKMSAQESNKDAEMFEDEDAEDITSVVLVKHASLLSNGLG